MKLPLSCPSTLEDIKRLGHELSGARGISYPFVGDIPWLFPDPKITLGDWRVRCRLLLDQLEGEIASLKTALKEATTDATRQRLETTRHLKIRNLEMLKRVLEPLKPNLKINAPTANAMGYRLPLRQGLLGYFPNLIRDWSGRFEEENKILFEATLKVLLETKPVRPENEFRALVLGAGASRLAYDFALKFPKSSVVAYDLNPMLLLAAKSINDGKKIHAVEYSMSAKDSANPGREVELAAPSGPAANLQFVFGDVYALPFPASTFDVVLTPWLIDIVPRQFDELARSIARVTANRGVWVNSGSWHFSFTSEVDNISLAEAEEKAAESGWKARTSSRLEVPYLQSTFDSHRRFETITQFSWERTSQAVPTVPPVDDRIDWIRNPDLAIPSNPVFIESSTTHAVKALVLSLVDGRRTLNDIARIVSEENGLPMEEALEAAQSFFDRFLKDRHFR